MSGIGNGLARSLQWRHNGHDSVSNHQPHDCLLNRLFGRRSKKTSKLRVTGLCAGNSPGTGEFRAQRASNAENVSIWWRHLVMSGNVCSPVIECPPMNADCGTKGVWPQRLSSGGCYIITLALHVCPGVPGLELLNNVLSCRWLDCNRLPLNTLSNSFFRLTATKTSIKIRFIILCETFANGGHRRSQVGEQ